MFNFLSFDHYAYRVDVACHPMCNLMNSCISMHLHYVENYVVQHVLEHHMEIVSGILVETPSRQAASYR